MPLPWLLPEKHRFPHGRDQPRLRTIVPLVPVAPAGIAVPTPDDVFHSVRSEKGVRECTVLPLVRRAVRGDL